MMTQAYDLFSGQYIEIDERKEFPLKPGDPDYFDPVEDFFKRMSDAIFDQLLYGSPPMWKDPVMEFRGLSKSIYPDFPPELYKIEYFEEEPSFGPPPAAKPDQP